MRDTDHHDSPPAGAPRTPAGDDSTRSRRPGARARAGGPLHLAWLSPPPGAPPAVHRRVRLARVRAALGPWLAAQLVDFSERAGSCELVFAGAGWERALAGCLDDLRSGISVALGREVGELTIVSRADLPPAASPAAPSPAPAPVGDAHERISRAARRILERLRNSRVDRGDSGR